MFLNLCICLENSSQSGEEHCHVISFSLLNNNSGHFIPSLLYLHTNFSSASQCEANQQSTLCVCRSASRRALIVNNSRPAPADPSNLTTSSLCLLTCSPAIMLTLLFQIHFLMILSSNWAYLKDASKMQAYQEIKAKEEQELQDIQSRSKEQLNSYT